MGVGVLVGVRGKYVMCPDESHPVTVAVEEADWHLQALQVIFMVQGELSEAEVVKAYEECILCAPRA